MFLVYLNDIILHYKHTLIISNQDNQWEKSGIGVVNQIVKGN